MGYGPSYIALLVGRCIAGVGVGFALMIAPIYSAEVSSPSSRGFLTSLPEIILLGSFFQLSIVTTYGFSILVLVQLLGFRYRALGAGIGVAVNRLMNATVSMSFLSISEAITTGGAFFMFAAVSLVALIFFYFMCPETKGKSLEEMESVFTRSKSSDNFKK